jgi:hypothetical protein
LIVKPLSDIEAANDNDSQDENGKDNFAEMIRRHETPPEKMKPVYFNGLIVRQSGLE